MIRAPNDQLRIGHPARDYFERIKHRLQPFVCAPFPERQNPMLGISAPLKCRVFRPARENSVIAHVDSPTAIFLPKNAAVRGHEDGNRIREQEHLRGGITCGVVHTTEAYARILEIYRLHELMKGDMSVEACGPNQRRKFNSEERRQGFAAEAGKTKIEPYDVRPDLQDSPQQAHWIAQAVKGPASNDGIARQFVLIGSNVIPEN